MNLNDWMYHLTLRTALCQTDFLDLPSPARHPQRPAAARARRFAIAGVALLAPALLVAAALLGG